jgi:3-hydroxyacyl-[acyl-carrier-protein] dehydratase
MIKEPLFKILATDHQDNTIHAVLDIDRDNKILEGHFPGQPVVPGACMLQLVKDTLADTLNKSIRLLKADNIKFLSLIDPGTMQSLQLEITYQQNENDIQVTANLNAGEVVCMKLQGVFLMCNN